MDHNLKFYNICSLLEKKVIKEVIIDGLKESNGAADFSTIFSYIQTRKNEIRLEAKNPQKTIRGILSKMKKEGIIIRDGINFCLKSS